MATNRWLGRAPAIAKTATLTIGSAVDADTFTVTINSKTISYTALSDTTATIASKLQVLLDACTEPEFRECAFAYPGTGAVITVTAATAGIPFTLTKGGTGTSTLTTTVASSGPNHVDLGANWSLGTVPSTDDVLIDGGPDLLWGFENLSAAAHTTFRVKGSFDRGKIGLPYWNPLGYVEYRGRSWPMNTAVPQTVGEGDGSGPSRFNQVSGAVLNLTVLKTASRDAGSSAPVVNVSGCSSGVLVAAGSSDVGLAADDDTLSATVTTATIGGTANLVNGKGGTITTANQDGPGSAVLNLGTVGTVNGIGGRFTHYGTISTAVNGDPGPWTFDWRCGGTIATATFKGQGPGQDAPVMECANDPRAKTITNGSFLGGAVLHDPQDVTVWSNPLNFDRASLAASDIGARFTLARVKS